MTDATPAEPPFVPPAPARASNDGVLLPMAAIDASGRVRAVNSAAVAQMADSIVQKGLITPLLVRPVGEDRYRLVLGGHRHAAVALLGQDLVRCLVRELDDDEALALELEENLARHELDALDYGIFCTERKALDERVAERNSRGGDRRSDDARSNRQVGEMVPRFTQELAERLGRSERTIQRAIATVKALDADTIALIRGTPVANNESQLRDLGRELNLNKRRALARGLLDGAKTIAKARIAIGDEEPVAEDPQDTHYGKLCFHWDQANEATRLRFLALIDAAVVGSKKGEMTPAMRAALAAPEPAAPPPRPGRKAGKGVH